MTMPLRRPLTLTIVVMLSLLAGACATQPAGETATPTSQAVAGDTEAGSGPRAAPTPSKAQQELAAGIASYENGQHRNATRQLQAALDTGLDSGDEKAQAHKYLAFIHCVSRRTTQCREEFRKAIAADPEFALTPAEAGHPTWGPVFRKLKAAKPAPAKTAAKPASPAK